MKNSKRYFLFIGFFYCFILYSFSQNQIGYASYYANSFHGKKSANGETHDNNDFTAAHRTFTFGTFVRVVNLKNNKSVVVRITDRGPFSHSRIIDVSYAAAKKLDIISQGVAKVEIENIGDPSQFKITRLMEIKMKSFEPYKPAITIPKPIAKKVKEVKKKETRSR
ncbi:MAG TPA: septal ring lytic transglycosylase RlpA family protein [Bacteroidales bacterium]